MGGSARVPGSTRSTSRPIDAGLGVTTIAPSARPRNLQRSLQVLCPAVNLSCSSFNRVRIGRATLKRAVEHRLFDRPLSLASEPFRNAWSIQLGKEQAPELPYLSLRYVPLPSTKDRTPLSRSRWSVCLIFSFTREFSGCLLFRWPAAA